MAGLNHWYDDHRNLASLANTMIEEGHGISGVLYMLAKPWKFEDLYIQTVTPAQEEKITPAPEFEVDDRVLRAEDDGRPSLGHWHGTVKIVADGQVGVRWDGTGPDQMGVYRPSQLQKED